MRYRTMGKTGWQISEVSLGGAYLMGNDPERAQESTNEVVRRAVELGINYIDTAPLYGKSEELLGGALEGVAEHFYIATKVGYDPPNFDYRGDSVLWSIERSLQRMRIPKLATAQIHEVNMAGWERITEPGGTLEGLREAQKRGLCERIGITGRAIPLLAKLAETGEFDTMLVYHDYHPCSQRAAKAVIPAAAAHDMGVVVATPLAGLLFADEPRRSEAVAAISDPVEQERVQRVLERLQDLPGTHAQNAFQYILTDPRVATVSSGAANIAELEDVAQASEMGPLSLVLASGFGQDYVIFASVVTAADIQHFFVRSIGELCYNFDKLILKGFFCPSIVNLPKLIFWRRDVNFNMQNSSKVGELIKWGLARLKSFRGF